MAINPTDKLDLAALETRVDDLIRTIESLQHENHNLRSQQSL